MFALRALIERNVEVQKDLFMCFIDYTKAFDKVKHDGIDENVRGINIDGKEQMIIKRMFSNQETAVGVENVIDKYQPVKQGVRQSCVLLLYGESLREIKNEPRIFELEVAT